MGIHLSRRLRDAGWVVHALVRPGSALGRLRAQVEPVQTHAHDGTTQSLLSILAAIRPELVCHVAAQVVTHHEPDGLESLIAANVTLGVQLVEAMVRNGVHSLVNTGTAWQHYEDRAYSPVNLYAATKQAFESLLQYYVEATPLRAVTLRLHDTYGPDDHRPKLIRLLADVARRSQPLAMSPGEQLMDLVYIDDVTSAYLGAAERLLGGHVAGHECYAVSSGEVRPLREVVALYERVADIRLPVEWGARPYRSREVMRPWSWGTPVPGWRPRVGLEEGLARVLQSERVRAVPRFTGTL